jgi:hypothetical protein
MQLSGRLARAAQRAWCHAAILCAGMLASACTADVRPPSDPADPATDAAGASQEDEVTTSTLPAGMADAALADARQRVPSAAAADVKVTAAEAVTWADGSLGCPEPGMMYTQALVPGYRITVQAGRETLHYHAGRTGPPKYCPPGRAEPAAPGTVDR